jgi:hypothetical protein
MLLYLSDGYLLGMLIWLCAGVLSFWLLLRSWRHWKTDARRLRFVQCGLSLWMLLASLTAIELYFALIYDSTDSFNMTNVSKKWFEKYVQPQQKALALGNDEYVIYRDDVPFPEAVTSDQNHVCFVGDSFTFGQGIPDVANRFSNRIRASLDADRPGDYIVSNLADAGRDLYWIELLLQHLFNGGRKLDTVVYVICLNDIETFHPRHSTYYVDLGQHSPRFFLFRDTYFFNLVYFRLKQFTLPDVQGYYSFVKEYYAGEPWRLMQRKLDSVADLCRSHGADFRIVVFPFLHNLGPDYPFQAAHHQIMAHCEERGIPAIDLAPVLAEHASEGLTVNPFDAHPNETANKWAAEAIQRDLLDDLFKSDNDAPSD